VVLVNCRFTDNSARNAGGGVFIVPPTTMAPPISAVIVDCYFIGNRAEIGDAGGLYTIVTANTTLRGCRFEGNVAGGGGGAHLSGGEKIITGCEFVSNLATGGKGGGATIGGGGFIYDSGFFGNRCFDGGSSLTMGNGGGLSYGVGATTNPVRITQCVFSGNSAENQGGGLWLDASASLDVGFCTFYGNSAESGGALFLEFSNQVQLSNSILWSDSARNGKEIAFNVFPPSVIHCDIEQPTPGPGVLFVDPLFMDPVGLDGVPGTRDDDLRLRAGSPCIDAGHNGHIPPDTGDIDGDGDLTEPLPIDRFGGRRRVDDPNTVDVGFGPMPIVDMGIHEHPGCNVETYCPAEINSTGLRSLLAHSGFPSVRSNSLVFHVSDGPAGARGWLIYGPERDQTPFGGGLLCIGQGAIGITRYSTITLGAAGEGTVPIDVTVPPANGGRFAIRPGSAWNFQFLYEDGTGLNLSNALSVVFCP
jgi:hypothetical protein